MVSRLAMALLFICLFCNSANASELLIQEALNYYNAGVKAQEWDDFAGAEINYQKAVLIDRRLEKFVFNNFGVMFAKRGLFQEAELAFSQALSIEPDYKTAISNIFLLYQKLYAYYQQQGSRDKAVYYLERALSYSPVKSFIIEGRKQSSQ